MIKDIIKGMIIGIANVIPGLSGGTIAVAMGIYDKIIYAVNNIFKNPKESIKLVWKYVIGMAAGVLLALIAITKLFELFRLPTTAIFIGLVLGSIPMIADKIKNQKISIIDICLFIFTIGILIVLPLFSTGAVKTLTHSVGSMIMLFIIGIIAAATMIIPGVSGSMMLMIMGYYESILNLMTDTVKAFFTLDMATFGSNLLLVLPFAVGVILGIVVIAKFIQIVLNKYTKTVFIAILGMILASPFGMILELGDVKFTPVSIIISLIALVIGVIVTMNLGEKDETEK